MICQMLFNNNIVHESLKVIQMNNTSYLDYCVEKIILKILIFLKQKI